MIENAGPDSGRAVPLPGNSGSADTGRLPRAQAPAIGSTPTPAIGPGSPLTDAELVAVECWGGPHDFGIRAVAEIRRLRAQVQAQRAGMGPPGYEGPYPAEKSPDAAGRVAMTEERAAELAAELVKKFRSLPCQKDRVLRALIRNTLYGATRPAVCDTWAAAIRKAVAAERERMRAECVREAAFHRERCFGYTAEQMDLVEQVCSRIQSNIRDLP